MIPDDPIIACLERTGLPPWMLDESPEDLDESPWPDILDNLEAYGNPAGPCLAELPPKGGTPLVI